MLSEMVVRWLNFKGIFVKYCSGVFSYLDRFYVTTAAKRKLAEEAYYIFKTCVFDNHKAALRSIILDQLEKDRNGELTDRSIVKEGLQLFHEMSFAAEDVYTVDIENYALEETRKYYRTEAQTWLSNCTLTDYLLKVCIALN